jgi:hypothetical protein
MLIYSYSQDINTMDLKAKLERYEIRYEELHKILLELGNLSIIKMRSKTSDEPKEFFDTFHKMFNRVLADYDEVKKECRKLHRLVYPEKYTYEEESDSE